LECIHDTTSSSPPQGLYCAGFELQQWRCNALADHLVEWMADYALIEDELQVSHANMYVRLREAATRVYTSGKYSSRGEIGEIVLHAICRDFFATIPIAPRVHYLTASNDVVKSFDMVHVRYTGDKKFEIWLGEAKFYKDGGEAIASAISSITAHIDAGFLKNEKLLLGPQISKSVPHYDEIRALLSQHTSLDKLFETAVFPVCIACDSDAVAAHTAHCAAYFSQVQDEIAGLQAKLTASGLLTKIRLLLLYVPLGSKEALAAAFDSRLKGLLQ
jgi:hypothetical protein